MGIVRTASRQVAGLFRERTARRPSGVLRRGIRDARPMAEDLEGRSLLSVGLDPTWGFGGTAQLNQPPNTAQTSYSQSINAITFQNGQVVEAGTQTTTPEPATSTTTSTTSLLVARLNTSGVVDSTFGSGGTAVISVVVGGVTYDPSVTDAAVQSSGKIDIFGTASTPSGVTPFVRDLMVAQLNSNGTVDTTFGNGGVALIPYATGLSLTSPASHGLAIGPDGKIDIAAEAFLTTSTGGNEVFAVTRLNANGSIDTTFNSAGPISGTATVSFPPSGFFPSATSINATPVAIVVQSNDSVVVAGSIQAATSGPSTTSVPVSYNAVVRLTSGGALDTTFNGTGLLVYNFNLGGQPSGDTPSDMVLSGSQIVIVGTSSQPFSVPASGTTGFVPSVSALNVARINSNGSLDTTFNGSGKFLLSLSQNGTTFNTNATSVVASTSGALLIGGSANEQNGRTQGSYYSYGGGPSGGLLLSLTPTGALDSTFGNNGAAIIPQTVDSRMFQQADGKVVFLSGGDVARTTAPAPAVTTTTINTTGTGKKAKATGVTITFNTGINPTLASNVKVYLVRPMKSKKAIKLKKNGIIYDATKQTLTFNFASKMAVGKGFLVVITPGGIVGADGQGPSAI